MCLYYTKEGVLKGCDDIQQGMQVASTMKECTVWKKIIPDCMPENS